MTTMTEPLDAQMLDLPGSDLDIAMNGSPQYWLSGEEKSMEETMEDADASVVFDTTDAQDVEIDMDGYQESAEYEMSDGEELIEPLVDQELLDVEVLDVSNDQPLDSNDFAVPSSNYDSELLPQGDAPETAIPVAPDFIASDVPLPSAPDALAPPGIEQAVEAPVVSEHAADATLASEQEVVQNDAPVDYEEFRMPHNAEDNGASTTEPPAQEGERQGNSHISLAESSEQEAAYTPVEYYEVASTEEAPAAEEQSAGPSVAGAEEGPQDAPDAVESTELPPLPEGSDEGYDDPTDAAPAEGQEVSAEVGAKDPHEISEGIYIDPPPPIMLFLSSTDHTNVCLFNSPSRSGTPAAGSSTTADEDYTVLLRQLPTLYYEPLSAVFDALRQEQAIMEAVDLASCELVLDAFDLQLVMSEDNVYIRDISLHEIDMLHDNASLPGSLRLKLQTVSPRFITRYSALRAQIAGLDLEGESYNEAAGQAYDEGAQEYQQDPPAIDGTGEPSEQLAQVSSEDATRHDAEEQHGHDDSEADRTLTAEKSRNEDTTKDSGGQVPPQDNDAEDVQPHSSSSQSAPTTASTKDASDQHTTEEYTAPEVQEPGTPEENPDVPYEDEETAGEVEPTADQSTPRAVESSLPDEEAHQTGNDFDDASYDETQTAYTYDESVHNQTSSVPQADVPQPEPETDEKNENEDGAELQDDFDTLGGDLEVADPIIQATGITDDLVEWDDSLDAEGEAEEFFEAEGEDTISNESSTTLSSKASKRSFHEVDPEDEEDYYDASFSSSPEKRQRVD